MRIEKKFKRAELKASIRIWMQFIQPKLRLQKNVHDLCRYGFIKSLNSVINNLESEQISISVCQRKGFTELELATSLELTNLKLIDEKLFFVTRMFDEFLIDSGGLGGTSIKMKIANNSKRSADEIFAQF